MARDLVRHHPFLPRPVSDRLEALARGPGASKPKILAEACRIFLDRRGSYELEQHFGHRLDRVSNQLGRIERNGQVDLESLALFVRYMLTVNAPLPDGDKVSQAIGADRFAASVERAGQQLASGRLTLLAGDRE